MLCRFAAKLSTLSQTTCRIVGGNVAITSRGQLLFGQSEPGEINLVKFKPMSVGGKTVKDFAQAWSHRVALASDGKVYSWGTNPVYNIINKVYNPTLLGHNNWNATTPVQVDVQGEFQLIAAGGKFTVALSTSHELYGWGRFRQYWQAPALLEQASSIAHEHHSKITTVKASTNYMMFQLQNGSLFSWGSNFHGAMGARLLKRNRIDLVDYYIHKVNDKEMEGQKVVQFEVGECSSVFVTDKGKVYFSGLEIEFWPTEFPLPQGAKVTSVAAGDTYVAVSTDQGVFSIGEFQSGMQRYRGNGKFPMYHSKEIVGQLGGFTGETWILK